MKGVHPNFLNIDTEKRARHIKLHMTSKELNSCAIMQYDLEMWLIEPVHGEVLDKVGWEVR